MGDLSDEIELESKVAFLQDANNSLSKQLSKEKIRTADLVEAVYRAASDAASGLRIPAIKAPAKTRKTKGDEVCVPIVSDLQLAKVTPDYNTDVCEQRMNLYADKVLELTEIQRSDHPVRKAHVICAGDIVEGELIFPGQCVDDQTEALTPEGWMRLDELEASGRPIATFDSDADTLVWDVPVKYNVYDHDGEMVHHKNTRIDHMVTPNHDMWVRCKGDYSKRKASEVNLPEYRARVAVRSHDGRFSVPSVEASEKSPGWAWDHIAPNDVAAFMGWIVSEGSCRYGETWIWQSRAANPAKWEEIRQLVGRLSFPGQAGKDVSVTVTDDGFGFNSVPLSRWVLDHLKTHAKDARLPRWAKDWPVEQLEVLLDALIKGDGWTPPSGTAPRYSTNSDQLADDVQEVCMTLGYGAVVGERTTTTSTIGDWTGEGSRRVVKITKGYNQERCIGRPERVSYTGRVWCPTVGTGLWFMRRNGKVCVTGNSFLIDSSLYRQVTVDGPRIMIDFLRRMLSTFEEVHVTWVIGNHGAIGGRSRREMDPESNADRMLGKIVQTVLADEKRLTWTLPEGPRERNWYAIAQVGNWRSLVIHGDQIRGHSGFPWYGLGKKVNGWASGAIPEEFDDVVMGHWHQIAAIPLNKRTVYVNGSTESYNTYAQENLAAMSDPAQWLLYVHPERGRVAATYQVDLT